MKVTFLSLVSAVFAVPTLKPFEGHQVLRIKISNDEQQNAVTALLNNPELKLSEWKHGKEMVDVQVPPETFDQFKAQLGLEYQVVIENLQALIDEQSDYSEKIALEQGFAPLDATTLFRDYRSTEEYMEFLLSLPGTTEFTMGTTFEKRPIRGVKFGTGSKQIVFNGGIHAREWISPATVTYITNFLTGNDPKAVALRDSFTFHVVPVLNPDGYAFTRASSSNRMWRKNREPTQGQSCIGTDVNRNFGFQWGRPGASGSACSDTFRGPSAFSSREAKALDNYITSLTNVVSYLDIHSYSQLWLYPWGYDCNVKSKDDQEFFQMSKISTDALKSRYGTAYKFGPSCTTIYQTSGTTVDHIYAVNNVKYSMTLELRDTGRFGFTLPANQIVPTGEETTDALVAFFNFIAQKN